VRPSITLLTRPVVTSGRSQPAACARSLKGPALGRVPESGSGADTCARTGKGEVVKISARATRHAPGRTCFRKNSATRTTVSTFFARRAARLPRLRHRRPSLPDSQPIAAE
jgi:hypothetical protein